jgi:hypothetical protein
MCPIGYEETPIKPEEAYSPQSESEEPWLIIGDIAPRFPVFHVRRFKDIITDLEQLTPKFFDIRHEHKGVQEHETREHKKGGPKFGKNTHCIIEFTNVSSTSQNDIDTLLQKAKEKCKNSPQKTSQLVEFLTDFIN